MLSSTVWNSSKAFFTSRTIQIKSEVSTSLIAIHASRIIVIILIIAAFRKSRNKSISNSKLLRAKSIRNMIGLMLSQRFFGSSATRFKFTISCRSTNLFLKTRICLSICTPNLWYHIFPHCPHSRHFDQILSLRSSINRLRLVCWCKFLIGTLSREHRCETSARDICYGLAVTFRSLPILVSEYSWTESIKTR